jgi:hypothetical protein
VLVEVLARSKELYDAEEARREIIEAKANSILGSTGLTVSLLIGAAGIVVGGSDFLDKWEVIAVGLLLVLTLGIFTVAAYKSLRAVRVAGWGSPDISILLDSSETDPAVVRRKWAAQLLRAREHNARVNREKGGWLIEAHAWYLSGMAAVAATSVALLVVLALFEDFSSNKVAALVQPTATAVASAVVTPTVLGTPTPTQVPATVSPSGPIATPTP